MYFLMFALQVPHVNFPSSQFCFPRVILPQKVAKYKVIPRLCFLVNQMQDTQNVSNLRSFLKFSHKSSKLYLQMEAKTYIIGYISLLAYMMFLKNSNSLKNLPFKNYRRKIKIQIQKSKIQKL